MVSLAAVTSGVIFIYACYVLVRALKIQQKFFIVAITSMILVGTMGGTFAYGYLYKYYH
jgi:hypothetical protein